MSSAAVGLVNTNSGGTGAAVLTTSGRTAKHIQNEVHAAMDDISVPKPAPTSYSSFGEWRDSPLGDTRAYGREGIRFFRRQKL